MIAQSPDLDTIFKRRGIHPKFWAGFRAFLEDRTPPSKALQTQLDNVANYKAAEKEALRELSRVYAHEFPPAGYRSPVPYESLLAEDIRSIRSQAPASAGVPSAAR